MSEPAPLVDVLAVYRRAASLTPTAWYWEQPSRAAAMVAAGVAWSTRPRGTGRFDDSASAWKAIVADAIGDVEDLVCFGAFSFDAEREYDAHWRAFGDGELVVPEVMYRRDGERARVTRATLVEPDAPTSRLDLRLDAIFEPSGTLAGERVGRLVGRDETPDSGSWMRSVEALTAAIRPGGVDKVVLAREVVLTAADPIDEVPPLARLRESYPNCTIFATRRGDACFLGATPERLVRVDERRVSVSCLAGSSRRGVDDADDAAVGAALLADPKERSEHSLVLATILSSLAPLCDDVRAPSDPVLMRMPNVQHLHTPVEATLRCGAGALDLLARLHPTPAVGGVPTQAALDAIREHEPFDRGWYAGPVGWLDARGNGEFAVAIRSGLVRGAEARLYAGCGIVRDSVPAREWEESMMKLRPMLCALHLL
ncbi:MAG TPA: isochorismate synthase [Acidimicrobiia bacterium]|nr:isochorismate synthase [Acidimicrobiia bacterium]